MFDDLLKRSLQPLLIVISGPSGVGKDSVIEEMKKRGLPFHFVVTATTRPKRSDEIDGEDYFFMSQEQFNGMIERGELLEHALVYNDYKGVPREQVRQALASGKDVVMRLDVQGAETVRSLCPDAILIFLSTRDEEELIQRLRSRRTETPESLKLRIEMARRELERVDNFDYYVINAEGLLDKAVDDILAILRSEHLRTQPRKVDL
jgi:guanylate kinase